MGHGLTFTLLRSALTHLHQGLGSTRARAAGHHFFTPARWLPRSAREDVEELLPVPPEKRATLPDPVAPPDAEGALPVMEDVKETEAMPTDAGGLLVVVMTVLNQERIAKLAQGWDVPETDRFLKALQSFGCAGIC